MRKNPLINKGEQTKIPFSFAEKPPSSFFLFFLQQSEGFTSTVANHMLGF